MRYTEIHTFWRKSSINHHYNQSVNPSLWKYSANYQPNHTRFEITVTIVWEDRQYSTGSVYCWLWSWDLREEEKKKNISTLLWFNRKTDNNQKHPHSCFEAPWSTESRPRCQVTTWPLKWNEQSSISVRIPQADGTLSRQPVGYALTKRKLLKIKMLFNKPNQDKCQMSLTTHCIL